MVISRKDLAAVLEVALDPSCTEKVTRLKFNKYFLIATRIQKKVKGGIICTGVTLTWESASKQTDRKGKFVIQVKKSGRWSPTIWTRGPVSKRAADKAILRAQKKFPEFEYRISPAAEK